MAGFLLGGVVRAAVLPLPGTLDVEVWKIWSYAAATGGVARMYGVGGNPPERRVHRYGGARTTVDYPPMALYELYLAGRAYRALYPDFPNTPALTVAVKLPVLLAEIGTAILILLWARRAIGEREAMWAGLAFWLNPAVLMDGPVLGYLDPLVGLPALGAVLAAPKRPRLAGALFGVAVSTKAQAVLIVPALALALWRNRVSRALADAAAAAAATAAAVVAPVLLVGAWPNMMRALQSLTRHDMLSGQAANLWWIVTYAIRTWSSLASHTVGLWQALTAPVRILAISTLVDVLHWPSPRPAAMAAVAVVAAWAVWRVRRSRDIYQQAALGAFLVHAYFVLAVQVHENHLFLAIPLLVAAAAGRPSYRPLLWTLTTLSALNLNFFYGLGRGVGFALPRRMTLIDATVPLAAIDVLVLVWFARLLSSEARRVVVPGGPQAATL